MAKPQAIQPGHYAAVSLVPGMAPKCCYIGQVQTTDEYGIRINQVHWDDKLDVIVGDTEDFFVPWDSITSMLVCTKDQPRRRFVRDRATAWQVEIEAMNTNK